MYFTKVEGGWDADGKDIIFSIWDCVIINWNVINSSGKGLNIWDVYTTNASNVLDGSTGQVACNSYNFYQKDVEALKSLGVF